MFLLKNNLYTMNGSPPNLIYFVISITFWLLVLLMWYLRKHYLLQDHKDFHLLFKKSFRILTFTFRSLIHMAGSRSSASFFCRWLLGYASTICCKDDSFLTELSWHHCWKSVDHKCLSLYLDSQLYSNDLLQVYLYANTTQSWLL